MNSGPAPPREKSSPRAPRGEANRVYVSNLSWGVDNSVLANLFNEQGKVLEARVIYDRESGKSRGFGFVTYGSTEEVENAVSYLDGTVSSSHIPTVCLHSCAFQHYCSFSVC